MLRQPLFCCFAFLLVSCDKPKEAAAPPENPTTPPRVTKTVRPADSEPDTTPEEIRETF